MARTKNTDATRKANAHKKVRMHKKNKGNKVTETGSVEVKVRKAHRYRPGTVALREIRKFQKSTAPCIRRAPFRRVVREVAQNSSADTRFREDAMLCLQEVTEMYLVSLLEGAHEITIASKKFTLDLNHLRTCGVVRQDPIAMEAWARREKEEDARKTGRARPESSSDEEEE